MRELAKKAGCALTTVYQVESELHDVRIDHLVAIADALGVSIDWLLDRSEEAECTAKPNMDYEDRLISAISEKGVTLAHISRKSGVNVDAVSNFRHHYTNAYALNVEAICDVLGISIDWLFGRKERMEI